MSAELMLICGSVRTGSTNAAALACVAEQLPAGWTANSYADLAELPHFNPDDDRNPLHPAVAAMREQLAAASAVLFCTPEYAGALPGSFKNLLDWTIGGGQLSDKPVAWINSSDRGATGAYAELESVLGYAGAQPVPAGCARVPVSRSAVIDGRVSDPDVRAELGRVAAALCDAVG